jgi:hypothetical protein
VTTPNVSPITREARLEWVPIEKMRVSTHAQRELRQQWVDELLASFDLEQLGNPTVNLRGGVYYVIDGQHRVEALRQMGWGDQQVECWVYEGLDEGGEAEAFLKLQNRLTVRALDKFRVSVVAGRAEEVAIDRVVRSLGLKITDDRVPGGIKAVGTLRRIYQRDGAQVLRRALSIVRDAYGDGGLEAATIDGIGLLCARYNGELDDAITVRRLGDIHGGVNGLLTAAEKLRLRTGHTRGHCVAAAAVDVINRGRGGNKLKSWWNET